LPLAWDSNGCNSEVSETDESFLVLAVATCDPLFFKKEHHTWLLRYTAFKPATITCEREQIHMRLSPQFAAAILFTAGAAAAAPAFQADVQPISPEARARMTGVSWSPACPVDPAELATVRMPYWGFDDQPHTGSLVIHRNLVPDILEIFHALYDARFPIERMQPYEDFAVGKFGENNDTVGFYCRPSDTDPGKFGMHSYGYAVDINPLRNPSRENDGRWWPSGSDSFAPRDQIAPGKIVLRSPIFEIFARHGWLWGGLWKEIDYMHFEKATLGAHPSPLSAPYVVDGLHYQE